MKTYSPASPQTRVAPGNIVALSWSQRNILDRPLVCGFSSPCSAPPNSQRWINSLKSILPHNQGDRREMFSSDACGGLAPEDTARLMNEVAPWASTRRTSMETFEEHYLIRFFSPCQQTFGNRSRNLSQNISHSSSSPAQLSSLVALRNGVISSLSGLIRR